VKAKRRICFVTGTRAEFGLMRTTLDAIRNDDRMLLQLVVTGTHLDQQCGHTIDEIRGEEIRGEGWKIDAVVDWPSGDRTSATLAFATGVAMSGIAREFAKLKSDIVMVVGDRVEAFACAAAASLSGIPLVHIHGGERATGQVDDMLRHAISKMAHVHLCATDEAKRRLTRMGEDAWRVTKVGAPGLDGIKQEAMSLRRQTTLPLVVFLMHPWWADDEWNRQFVSEVVGQMLGHDIELVMLMPNGDPGSKGVRDAIESFSDWPGVKIERHVRRPEFLGLLRDAAVLVGNSSSGIIEAASFGTRVIDIGPRQFGRMHGKNVRHVEAVAAKVGRLFERSLSASPIKVRMVNPYGDGKSAGRIVERLAKLELNAKLLNKTIAY
jgi:GDP/UDP-N,N'-diacetylbacillosamine 2-epimerase (hydrolysing)